MSILDELVRLSESDELALHMPGHKRKGIGALKGTEAIDITEIEGYDNLYDAEGILKEAVDRAAHLYNCPNTYYLINGSTGGNLTAISAVSGKTDNPGQESGKPASYSDLDRQHIIIASNCHRSVRSACELNRLIIHELIVDALNGDSEIYDGVSPENLSQLINKLMSEGITPIAVVITSPNYDGIISDIGTIVKICHNKKIPLIVDEAHGAHLSLHKSLPKGALDFGADIVIHSMHKTLRAMTQTALLHVSGDLVDITQVNKYYRIFQSSSPSYVLMASMDEAVCELMDNADTLFERFMLSKGHFLQMIQGLSCLRVLGDEDLKGSRAYALDPCKITVDVTTCPINGYELQRLLLQDYRIQLEIASEDRVVAITTYADSREDLERFALALLSIDDMIKTGRIGIPKGQTQAERAADKNMYAPCIG